MTGSRFAQHDLATVTWFPQRDRVQPRGPNRQWGAHSCPRVRIVETKTCGSDVWLRFDTGDTMTVGGLLLEDPDSLRRAVAQSSLEAMLVLPSRVTDRKSLATYLQDQRRRKPWRHRTAAPRG